MFRTMKSPSNTYINMDKTKLAIVFPTQVDKNGTAMRCGKTADYRDASGAIHFGVVVTTYTEELFEYFVEGCEVVL